MEPLSDDAQALITAFSAQKYQETGRPGMVVFVVSPTADAETMRHDIYYLTIEEIAAMLQVARETDQERAAFTLIVDGPQMRTEVLPRGTRH
jgi:hypothetical protein